MELNLEMKLGVNMGYSIILKWAFKSQSNRKSNLTKMFRKLK